MPGQHKRRVTRSRRRAHGDGDGGCPGQLRQFSAMRAAISSGRGGKHVMASPQNQSSSRRRRSERAAGATLHVVHMLEVPEKAAAGDEKRDSGIIQE